MKEITRSCITTTELKGSTAAAGAEALLKAWAEEKIIKATMSFADQVKKKGEDAADSLERILSVFHRDQKGRPVIGAWQVKRMLMEAGWMIFNAKKDPTHPKKDQVTNFITSITPHFIPLSRDKKTIIKPDCVHTVAMSKKEGGKTVSFFKAYETLNPGLSFGFTVKFAENIVSEEHVLQILDAAQNKGLYAWRERYGKYEYAL